MGRRCAKKWDGRRRRQQGKKHAVRQNRRKRDAVEKMRKKLQKDIKALIKTTGAREPTCGEKDKLKQLREQLQGLGRV